MKINKLNSFFKRFFDIIFSFCILVITSPILILIVISIYILSPGPIFYKARRSGLNNRSFNMYKFRSMKIRKSIDENKLITAPNDNRIYPFGLFIRRFKLDELPQFVNVLKGQMSIVGPRPEDPLIVQKYYNKWMLETLSIKPGITGPGSVYGYLKGESLITKINPLKSYVDNLLIPKLALERAYLERTNLLNDFHYIILTIFSIIAFSLKLKINLPKKDIQLAQYIQNNM